MSIETLADIDTAFFANSMKGNVTISWQSDADDIYRVNPSTDKIIVYGIACPNVEGYSEVYLNAAAIFQHQEPRKIVWQTLFHELVVSLHQYYFLAVANTDTSTPTLLRSVRHVTPASTMKKTQNEAGPQSMDGVFDGSSTLFETEHDYTWVALFGRSGGRLQLRYQ